MAEDRDQAYQDPTASRLRRAEQSGQFARSRELAAAIVWLGGIAILATLGATLYRWLVQLASNSWSTAGNVADAGELFQQQWLAGQSIFWRGLLPILGGLAALAVLAHWFQNGFRFLPQLAVPDPGRLLPQRNWSRIFSAENLAALGFNLLKFALLVMVGMWIVVGDWQTLLMTGGQRLQPGSEALSNWLISAATRLCVAMVLTGLADYGLRWYLHRRSLQMTEQEIREERRSTEPSPEIEARRRLLANSDG